MLGSSDHVRVRRGRPADATALAGVFRDSWQTSYRGIIPHLHLETMIRRRGVEWWSSAIRSGDSVMVMEVSGTVAGYATCGAARGRIKAEGEIFEIYLGPDYQGLGYGEWLFEGCRAVLDERRLRGLVVWVLAANTPAIAFYWRRGGRPVAKAYDRIGSEKLEKIAFTWG